MIKGTANLNLSKIKIGMKILINKPEKSTYDQFLIATIIKNTKSFDEAMKIINVMTGKGNLNNFFISKYNEIRKNYNDEEIKEIISSSLIKIMLEKNFTFEYIPTLDITKFYGNIYKGKVFENKDFILKQINDDEEFVNTKYTQTEEKNENSDNYDFLIENDIIKIKFGNFNKNYYEISNENFENSLVNNLDIEVGKINIIDNLKNANTNANLNLLNKDDIKLIENKITIIYNEKIIDFYEDCVKEKTIYKYYNAYWIEENKLFYNDKKNRKAFTEILNILLKSKKINEIKNKIISKLISSIENIETKFTTVNELLQIKDSPEIAKIALSLITFNRNEVKFNWNFVSLESMYTHHENVDQLIEIYKLSDKINYSVLKLHEIDKKDKTILNNNHKNELNYYLNDIKKINEEINKRIGKMSQSGLREELKKHNMDNKELRDLRKFYNKEVAHPKMKKNKIDLKELKNKLDNILIMEKIHDKYLRQFKKKKIDKE